MAIINNIKPFINIGVGDIIREQMEIRNWKQKDMSDILGVSLKHINQLLQNNQPLTLDMANRLANAFNTSPQYWINIDTNYRLNLKVENNVKENEIKIKSEIYGKMPIREMYKKHWLRFNKNSDDFKKQILKFWNVDNLNFDLIMNQFAFNTRKSEAYTNFNQWHLMCWMQMAYKSSSKFKTAEYNKDLLVDLYEHINEYTIKDTGISDFISSLNNAGVKFIILSHLQKTYLDGAAFFEDKNPVIVYTARYKRIDNFWFTIAHEIAHILLHLKNNKDYFVDIINTKYSEETEKEADALASEKLHHREILEYFRTNMNYISKSKIIECSEKYKIHPSIIAGTLAYNKKISYSITQSFNKNVLSLIPDKYKVEKNNLEGN